MSKEQMTKSTIVALAITASLACSKNVEPNQSQQNPTAKGNTMKQAQVEVQAAVLAMTEAFHAGDIEGVMRSYADKATIVFEPGSPLTDKAQQRAAFEGSFAIKPRFSYAGHEVFVAGDTAMHIAPWTMRGTAPDGSEISQEGLSVAVLARQSDGAWKIVLDDPHGGALLQTR